jgi:hypothetical protein
MVTPGVLSVIDTTKGEPEIVPCPGFMTGAATVPDSGPAKAWFEENPHPHSTKTKRLGTTTARQRKIRTGWDATKLDGFISKPFVQTK